MIFDKLPLPQRLSLAHSGPLLREKLGSFLLLDARLAQFVSQASEPMLAQMRIAWWRDQLGKPAAERPQGDPVLDSLSHIWQGEEIALQCLIDGWEGLLAEPPLPKSTALAFATGRAACFAAYVRLAGSPETSDAAYRAGMTWALADLAARVSDAEEREFVIQCADPNSKAKFSLPFRFRALSILGKLGQRALDRGGSPLITGRGDLLSVTRLGLLGR